MCAVLFKIPTINNTVTTFAIFTVYRMMGKRPSAKMLVRDTVRELKIPRRVPEHVYRTDVLTTVTRLFVHVFVANGATHATVTKHATVSATFHMT